MQRGASSTSRGSHSASAISDPDSLMARCDALVAAARAYADVRGTLVSNCARSRARSLARRSSTVNSRAVCTCFDALRTVLALVFVSHALVVAVVCCLCVARARARLQLQRGPRDALLDALRALGAADLLKPPAALFAAQPRRLARYLAAVVDGALHAPNCAHNGCFRRARHFFVARRRA